LTAESETLGIMSTFSRQTRRTLIVGLLLVGSALPAAARADAALDLVRSLAAEPAERAPAVAAKARKPASSRLQRPRPARPARAERLARPAPRLRLTAAQRGSGRVDVLHVGDQADAGADSAPAVEHKSGFGRGLVAARLR
jgi:hypothetical protein